jgi:hypothetical protein
MIRRMTLLVVLLRLAGAVMVLAFLAVVLPVDWMAGTHRWLGLGEFPRAPIVDYLARSVALLYGFHGVLVLIVSRDPVQYRTIIWYLAVMNILFGAIIIAIDIHAGLPAMWTLLDGPPVTAFGIVIGLLNHQSGR